MAHLRAAVDAVPELPVRQYRLHGGGIKMFRSLILFKQSLREMFTLVHPQAVSPLRIAGRRYRTASSTRCWPSSFCIS